MSKRSVICHSAFAKLLVTQVGVLNFPYNLLLVSTPFLVASAFSYCKILCIVAKLFPISQASCHLRYLTFPASRRLPAP